MKTYTCLLIALLAYCLPAMAQYNEGLDPSFGTKGIVVTPTRTIHSIYNLNNGLLQADGKILALAQRSIARYLPGGDLDPSFGHRGIFSEPLYYKDLLLDSFDFRHTGIALQPDGKIIVSGCTDEYWSFMLFRIHADGRLDSSFGTNGVVLTQFEKWTFQRSTATGMVLQADGKIIVSGHTTGRDTAAKIYYEEAPTMIRYHSNGLIDSSFGKNGMVFTQSGPRWEDCVPTTGDIELCDDGRIVQCLDEFAIARYLPDGNLDTSFNHTGITKLFSGFAPYSKAMAVRPDGRIWVAGYRLFDEPTSFILASINKDGSVDTGFDPLGYKEYPWEAGDQNKCRDLLLLPDGKVLLAGRAMNPLTLQYNFGIMRIWPDGTPDTGFGHKSKLLTHLSSSTYPYGDELYKLLLQPDGKILALGETATTGSSAAPRQWAIARYEANGHTGITNYGSGAAAQIAAFPNPAAGSFRIQAAEVPSRVDLTGTDGTLLRQWIKPEQNAAFDIRDLPQGLYFIRIFLPGNQQAFIKLLH